jgi:hypothetical protein
MSAFQEMRDRRRDARTTRGGGAETTAGAKDL